MKVLQLNSVYGVGSTGRIARDIALAVQKDGGQCITAYGRRAQPDTLDSLHISGAVSNAIHLAGTRLFDRHGEYSFRATRRLIRFAQSFRPDIIQLHNLHGYYLNYPLLFDYLTACATPVVWTLHDSWAFTGHCCYYDRASCDKWIVGCSSCPQKREYPSSLLIDSSSRNYALKKTTFTGLRGLHLVTPSQWLADELDRSFLQTTPVSVIPNGVNLGNFSPTPSQLRDEWALNDSFILLGVASPWSERKGLNHFMDLADLLDPSFKIVLVGLSDAQRRRLPRSILGLPSIRDTRTLAQIYTVSDAFLNLTMEDNFPSTNLEALACGTPVVTFRSGGSAECLDNRSGRACPPGDLDTLADIVHELRAARLAPDDCTHRALEYSSERAFRRYVELYRSLLQDGS